MITILKIWYKSKFSVKNRERCQHMVKCSMVLGDDENNLCLVKLCVFIVLLEPLALAPVVWQLEVSVAPLSTS